MKTPLVNCNYLMIDIMVKTQKDTEKQLNQSTIHSKQAKQIQQLQDIFSLKNGEIPSLKILNKKHFSKNRQTLQNISKIVLQNVFKSSNLILDRRKIISNLNINRRRIFDVLAITTSIGILFAINRNQYQFRSLQTLQRIINGQKYVSQQNDSQIKKLSIGILRYLFVSKRKVSIQQISNSMHECFQSSQTRGRRIYDVLNVFLAYSLIKKCKQEVMYYEWVSIQKLKEFCSSKIKTQNIIKIQQQNIENSNQIFLLQPFVFCFIQQ